MARPRKEVNWKQVEKMCHIDCTGEEIAAVLGISYDTLDRACIREQNQSFADYFSQKRGVGNTSLRRRQYKAAMDGSNAMLIWLGKQRLGQSEKSIVDNRSSDGSMTPQPATIRYSIKNMTDEQIEKMLNRERK